MLPAAQGTYPVINYWVVTRPNMDCSRLARELPWNEFDGEEKTINYLLSVNIQLAGVQTGVFTRRKMPRGNVE